MISRPAAAGLPLLAVVVRDSAYVHRERQDLAKPPIRILGCGEAVQHRVSVAATFLRSQRSSPVVRLWRRLISGTWSWR